MPLVTAEDCQLWKITVYADHTAALACEKGDGNVVLSKKLPFTPSA